MSDHCKSMKRSVNDEVGQISILDGKTKQACPEVFLAFLWLAFADQNYYVLSLFRETQYLYETFFDEQYVVALSCKNLYFEIFFCYDHTLRRILWRDVIYERSMYNLPCVPPFPANTFQRDRSTSRNLELSYRRLNSNIFPE